MAQGIFNLKQVNQAARQGAWSAFNPPKFVEYLVVAGGGGGSCGNAGGGGGAGGLLTSIVTVTPGASYSVTVGAGGAGAPQNNDNVLDGSSGVNSVFGSISATGGGGGAGNVRTGLTGGSGGGAGGAIYGSFNPLVGQSVSGQGNSGGMSTATAGGGGGGAGTVGLNAPLNNTFAADGGAGIASSISGTTTVYAGGGGGGGDIRYTYISGIGGVGGGGSGSVVIAGTSGTTNTGGGGGGGGFNYALSNSTFYAGGNGGSGIVVVRYPGNIVFYTGGTVNYNNGYISHIFTSNGTLAPTAPTPYDTSYQISRSLRFNRADTNTLTRTPAVAGSRTTYSLSFWIKNPFSSGNDNPFWGQFDSNRESLAFSGYSYSHNPIVWIPFTGFEYRTTQGFRDNSAWYHVVAVGDSTNATAGDRARLYINGSRVTDFAASPTITQNSQTGQLNTAVLHYIGQQWYGDGGLTGFYLTEMHFIDGQALTPASFGATSTTTGVWAPIKYAGTYGTNGFYINFSDNSNNTAATLGKDYSGNGNNWTPNNFSVTAGANNDIMVDSPTSYGIDTGVGGEVRGNYCTLNPLANYVATLSNGNLDLSTSTSGAKTTLSTIGISSGKWYWEMLMNASGEVLVGIADSSAPLTGFLGGGGGGGWSYDSVNGQKYNNNNTSAYGSTFTTADLIGIAFDADAGTLVFYKNNTSQGTAYSGLASNTYFPACTVYASGTSVSFNFGQRPFAYTAPTGFKALCTQNLPTPAIGGTSETLANEFFGATTYTGNSSTQSIVNSGGFQPDWVWIKGRSSAYNHQLFDAVRGVNKTLYTNLTNSDFTDTDALTAFNSNGFTLGAEAGINYSSDTYVAWQWRAGNNSGSANTVSGSIASVVSVNERSGFSIVSYTATGAGTIGHGLGVRPSMIIAKSRSGSSGSHFWAVWHTGVYATDQSGYLNMNSVNGTGSASTVWSTTSPTSTVFSIGGDTSTSASAATYIAYCFAPVEGYSAFGSYKGNGDADGPFTYTGFRPAFVLIKKISGTGSWCMYDNARSPSNAVRLQVFANTDQSETAIGADNFLDIYSNGFKNRNTAADKNESGGTYIYMAFAENPFKYSLAR